MVGEYLIEVVILKKVSLILRAASREAKTTWLSTARTLILAWKISAGDNC